MQLLIQLLQNRLKSGLLISLVISAPMTHCLPVSAGTQSVPSRYADGEYRSPYQVEFAFSPDNLFAPDMAAPRNDIRFESDIPYDGWYSRRVLKTLGAWGPKPLNFPPPYADFDFTRSDPEWMRERVLAVAMKYLGLPYQHHHIPDWDPPAGWPWKEVAYGRNSRGLDCSNFSSWVYNYGLGLRISGDVEKQALEGAAVAAAEGGFLPIETIQSDGSYESLSGRLKTGDLLYIMKDGEDKVSHVIMWVGAIGRSPDACPLIIDCTGSSHRDCNGVTIPIGVHLRPFSKDSWYFRRFSHAHRIIRDSGLPSQRS